MKLLQALLFLVSGLIFLGCAAFLLFGGGCVLYVAAGAGWHREIGIVLVWLVLALIAAAMTFHLCRYLLHRLSE